MPSLRLIVRNILVVVLTLLGVLLASLGMQRASRIEDVIAQPRAEWISKPNELESLRAAAVGRYVTGNEPGDRGIEVRPEGRVRFFRVLEKGERVDAETEARLGRINSRLNFVTPDQGTIEVVNIDTLAYYRDTYRRTR